MIGSCKGPIQWKQWTAQVEWVLHKQLFFWKMQTRGFCSFHGRSTSPTNSSQGRETNTTLTTRARGILAKWTNKQFAEKTPSACSARGWWLHKVRIQTVCYSWLKEFKNARNNHQSFWVSVWGKYRQGNHIIIVTKSLPRSFVFKMIIINVEGRSNCRNIAAFWNFSVTV